jgi:hypothetical protein
MARYQLILESTKDAQGDLERTSGSYANQQQRLISATKSLTESLGNQLLPTATKIVSGLGDLALMFANMDTGTRNALIALTLFSVGVVPAVKGILTLKTAVMALNSTALFSPVGLIAGIAAVAAGLIVLGQKAEQARVDKIRETFKGVEEATKLSDIQIKSLVDTLARLQKAFPDNAQVKKTVDGLAGSYGITATQVNALVQASTSLNDKTKQQVAEVTALSRANEKTISDAKIAAETSAAEADARKKAAEEAKRLQEAQDALNKLAADELLQLQAKEELDRQIQEINDAELMTEKERETVLQRISAEQESANEAQAKALQKKIDMTEKYVQQGLGGMLAGFGDLGEALVNQEDGFKAFGKSAVLALAAVLDALGAQLAAQAALSIASSWSTGGISLTGAAPAIAGSAAAYTAAGVVRGYAGKFEEGGVIPGRSMTGDKMLASVNSGEVVYTQEQNARILELLETYAGGRDIILQVDGLEMARSTINYQRAGKV